MKLLGNASNNDFTLTPDSNVKLSYLNSLGQVKIEWESETDFEKIEIVDILGKLVYQDKVSRINTCYISTQEFVSGVYVVKLSGRKFFTTKVLL